jgi:hypothetical protein
MSALGGSGRAALKEKVRVWKLIEQCLGVLQDRRVEAFGEPGERPSAAPIWAS